MEIVRIASCAIESGIPPADADAVQWPVECANLLDAGIQGSAALTFRCGAAGAVLCPEARNIDQSIAPTPLKLWYTDEAGKTRYGYSCEFLSVRELR